MLLPSGETSQTPPIASCVPWLGSKRGGQPLGSHRTNGSRPAVFPWSWAPGNLICWLRALGLIDVNVLLESFGIRGR